MYSLATRLKYWIGTQRGRLIFGRCGAASVVDLSLRVVAPRKISLGERCEIREACFFDARSRMNTGIAIDDECRIKDSVALLSYGGSIELGKRVLIGRQVTVYGHGGVRIGRDSMIGPGCTVVSSNHVATSNGQPFQDQGFTREEISIGENVWIGANCVVLAGAEIGPSVVIAAGSVASGKLESGAIYRGNPAIRVKPLPSGSDSIQTIEHRDWGWLEQ